MKEWEGEKPNPFMVNDQFSCVRSVLMLCPSEIPYVRHVVKTLTVRVKQNSR